MLINNPIYLDNNATTKIAPEVVEAMMPFLTDYYGNASAMYSFGGQIKKSIVNAREQVAELVNAEADEIVFTACGTESDNAAIYSAFATQPEKKILITTKVEHSAVLNPSQIAESNGKQVIRLDVDEHGQLDLAQLENILKTQADDVALASIMYANNETGTLFHMDKIAQLVKSYGVLLHVDAVPTIGKHDLDLQKLPIDFLAMSGHKIHAPKGIGVLYVRKGTRFRPYLVGGHQEDGRRAGTENVPYIIGLGKACELAKNYLQDGVSKTMQLRDTLESTLQKEIPLTKVNGDIANRLPNTTNISFKNVEGEALLLMLNSYNICASSGSACTSGSLEPSHVLRAMGIDYTYAHGSVRFSLSRYTSEDEIAKVCEVMPTIVKNLRAMSPFKD